MITNHTSISVYNETAGMLHRLSQKTGIQKNLLTRKAMELVVEHYAGFPSIEVNLSTVAISFLDGYDSTTDGDSD